MPVHPQPRTIIVSSYIPRQCGIATFTHDLAEALANNMDAGPLGKTPCVRIAALNDRGGEYEYPSEVAIQIGQHRKEDYRNAAEMINAARLDVVNIQHEYGLYGGTDGSYLFEFLARIHKPVITTLHTVLSEPTPGQRQVLRDLCHRSEFVVVMAERARTLLHEVYDMPATQIRLIHHGVPDIPYGDTEPYKARFEVAGRPLILTFGLLSPGKGIEVALDALAKVVPNHPEVAYIILGVTHPVIKRESGESYRIALEQRAASLGLQKNVIFHNHYASLDDLCEYLQAADLYVTPYLSRDQITSGTLAYAVAAGKAVVSTPYWYAQELLADGRGRLFGFGDADGLAEHLAEMLDHPDRRRRVCEAAHAFGRQMVWPRVAQQYVGTLDRACRRYEDRRRGQPMEVTGLTRMSLPATRLDHLYTLTDDTGLLQHAVYAVPDRRHGYCTDDNARALIVATMADFLLRDETILPHLKTYLSFMHYAQKPTGGRFHNFMAYDRRWLDDVGGDDCQGRAMWALGHHVARGSDESTRGLALDLFRRGLPELELMTSPRAWSFAILGLHYVLRRFPDDPETRRLLEVLSGRLNAAFEGRATPDWPWPEDKVTYENARLPQALIIAGFNLDNAPMKQRGLDVLSWLLDIQKLPNGRLCVIGCNGWYPRDGEPARYDQQSVEPAGLIGACRAAYRATGDVHWLEELRRCFEWFLGQNSEGLTLVDFKTRGCRDGLSEGHMNANQGGESCVVWLMSLLIMYQMQSRGEIDLG